MSKFNMTKKPAQPDTLTYEGAQSWSKRIDQEWFNNLMSNMVEDGFYEDSATKLNRYIDLTKQMLELYGSKFVARAAYFARNDCGMRSISQVTAALLNNSKFDGKRDFYARYMHRPDDISEIFSFLESQGEKRSHALVRGARDYLSSLNAYSLDKYKMLNKDWSMYDLINITHAHSKEIDDFKNGTLQKAGTWEQRVSGAESQEHKHEIWREMVEENRLGYLALIRNLNNILDDDAITSEWIDKYLVPQLTDAQKIRKSLVFPYQIYCAYKNLKARPYNLIIALDRAFRESIGNVPGLNGNSLIILDVSGSMEQYMSGRSNMSILEVGAVYAAAIYLSNPDSDFVKFATDYKMCKYNRLDNVFDIISKMQDNDNVGYQTNIGKVWKNLTKHYNRIFLFSDMQVMNNSYYYYFENNNAYNLLVDYFARCGDCPVYSFDLANYSNQLDNPDRNRLKFITGLNDNVFKFIELSERGENIVDYINEKYSYIV